MAAIERESGTPVDGLPRPHVAARLSLVGMTGRAVLVTGASRGIGRAIAEAFAVHGDRVAVHYNASAAEAAEVRTKLPGDGHVLVQGDVSDPAAIQSFVDEAAAMLGGLDVVVNNAAVFPPHPILETSYVDWQEAWQQTLAANLVGPANVCWCAARHLRSGGRIINVSSRGAFRGSPASPPTVPARPASTRSPSRSP